MGIKGVFFHTITARKIKFSFSRRPGKKVFSKKAASGHDLFCIIWKDSIFFPENTIFFLGQEASDNFSQEIHGNAFCVHAWVLQAWCHAPLPKKIKMALSRKNTPKGDWRSRLTPWKEPQQVSVTSQRPLRAFSCIALQRKKPGNLINRIEAWLLLQFIRLEIFYNE